MMLLKMGLEVPSRALPALCRSEKEGGRRPPESSRLILKAASCVGLSVCGWVGLSVGLSVCHNFTNPAAR